MPSRVRQFRNGHRSAVISMPMPKSATYHIIHSVADYPAGLVFQCQIGDFFGLLSEGINHVVKMQPDLRAW